MRAELQAAEARWERRLADLDPSWKTRFGSQDGRWERQFGKLQADIRSAEEYRETRFGQLPSLLWWLSSVPFTTLLALVALLTRAFAK